MKRTSFLSDDESDHKHLRFVISDEDDNGEYLVVTLESHYSLGYEDESCLLSKGDHPFINHKSWINYGRAFSLSREKMEKGFNTGVLIKKQEIKFETLDFIQRGAEKTDRLPEEFIHFFDFF